MGRRTNQMIEAGLCGKGLHRWVDGQERCEDCHPDSRPCDVCGRGVRIARGKKGETHRHHACRLEVQARLASPFALPTSRTCDVCGDKFISWSGQGLRCSEECKREALLAWHARKVERTCAHCGNTYQARVRTDKRAAGEDGQSRYCSNRCIMNAVRGGRPPGEFVEQKPDACPVWFHDCRECGELFTARRSNSKDCGIDCRRARNLRIANQRAKDLYRLATTLDVKGKMWRRVLLDALVHSDGPDCGICGEPVDLEVKSGPSGDGRGHSFDHVIPRSLGGPDTLDNLRLTHWECNHLRFAKPAPGEAFVYTLDGTVSEVIAV